MRPGAVSSLRFIVGLGAFAPLSLVPAARAVSEPSLVTGKKESYAYSWQQEVQLGAEADQELVQTMGLYENPELQTYVQAVGERIAAHSSFANPSAPEIYRGTKLTFRIIDSTVVNAFALPGGYIYVTRGLLSHLDNEAQLAVVLGHEIGHVAARHSSQQARRAQWGQLGAIFGAILGQKVLGEQAPNIGNTILNVGGKAVQMLMFKHSREAEYESDSLGVNSSTLAGYAAGESAAFFRTLKTMAEAEGKALPSWQSTHPDPGDRAERVTQLAAQVPRERADNVGEGEYLRHIEGLVIGEDPRAGFAQNGVFYHPVLKFQLPVSPGWKLENQRSAVLMAEPSGRAMMGLRMAGEGRSRDAATRFTQENKIKVTASGDTAVNGLPTSVVMGEVTTEEGAVAVWNAFIEMDGQVYSLLGYSEPKIFDQMRPTFETVAAGFSPLRVAEAINVQPTRLKVVRADRNAPLATFIPTALPGDLTAEKVANMNQRNLNDNVTSGQMIKVPEGGSRPNFAHPGQYPNNEARQPQTQYPPQGPYGQSSPNYPAQQYPSGSSTNYPGSNSYPQQPGYPQGNPSQQSGYPQPSGYPQQGYPQQSGSGYPPQQPSSYPSSQPGYPNQQPGYPQPGGTNQPASPYPGQTYPPQPGYPQNQPYPGQGTSTNQSGQAYPSYPPSYPSTGSNYPSSQPSRPQFPQPPGANPSSHPQQQPATTGPNWPR